MIQLISCIVLCFNQIYLLDRSYIFFADLTYIFFMFWYSHVALVSVRKLQCLWYRINRSVYLTKNRKKFWTTYLTCWGLQNSGNSRTSELLASVLAWMFRVIWRKCWVFDSRVGYGWGFLIYAVVLDPRHPHRRVSFPSFWLSISNIASLKKDS